jgi:hypothetical protein
VSRPIDVVDASLTAAHKQLQNAAHTPFSSNFYRKLQSIQTLTTTTTTQNRYGPIGATFLGVGDRTRLVPTLVGRAVGEIADAHFRRIARGFAVGERYVDVGGAIDRLLALRAFARAADAARRALRLCLRVTRARHAIAHALHLDTLAAYTTRQHTTIHVSATTSNRPKTTYRVWYKPRPAP